LENAKEVVAELVERIRVEIKWQKKVEKNENLEKMLKVKLNLNPKKFRRSESLGKYMVGIFFEQDNRKFENEYLKKLERNWER